MPMILPSNPLRHEPNIPFEGVILSAPLREESRQTPRATHTASSFRYTVLFVIPQRSARNLLLVFAFLFMPRL
jgi:hypothetical protein